MDKMFSEPDVGEREYAALRKLNAQVTREWDELEARIGPHTLEHPEASALFDMQWARGDRVMTKACHPLSRVIISSKLVILEDVWCALQT